MPRIFRLLTLVMLLAPLRAGAASGDGAAPTHDAATAKLMRPLFERLIAILPLALDAKAFAAPKTSASTGATLKELADGADAFAAHAAGRDEIFAFIAAALQGAAVEAPRRFARGDPDGARFLVLTMTEACIACHENLPDGPVKAQAPSQPVLQSLPMPARAWVLVMGRQFDDALQAWEDLLQSGGRPATDPAAFEDLANYLRLALSVRRDPARPRTLFEKLATKAAAPRSERDQLARWAGELEAYQRSGVLATGDLGAARRLLEDAQAKTAYSGDRAGLVAFLAAQAVAGRVVAAGKASAEERGRAYYVMGLSEAALDRQTWVAREEALLEAAIRLAPGDELAQKALARLESDARGHAGFAPSPARRAVLADLRRLVDRAGTRGRGTDP